jgi:hypothetical protein
MIMILLARCNSQSMIQHRHETRSAVNVINQRHAGFYRTHTLEIYFVMVMDTHVILVVATAWAEHKSCKDKSPLDVQDRNNTPQKVS